jgi:hypothetical protein
MSHRTAITRTKLSAPMNLLATCGYISGRTLDYGCGKGFDAYTLSMEKYDPYFKSERPTGTFDTITCIYVLNVVEESQEIAIIKDVKSLLNPNGRAFFAVRRDKFIEGTNTRGTYQRMVFLKAPFKTVAKTPSYEIYELNSGEL